MAEKNSWDDEEIVPLGELRPSREHFGPLPSSQGRTGGKPQRQDPRARRAEPPRRQQAPRPRPNGRPAEQPAGNRASQPRPPQSQTDQPVRRAPAAPAPDQVQRRAAAPQPRPQQQPQSQQSQQPRPQGPQPQYQQRPQAPQPRPQSQQPRPQGPQQRPQAPVARTSAPGPQRPRRQADDEFANGLAAEDRAPVMVRPSSGWRGAVLKATGGVVNLGLSSDERRENDLRAQLRRPVTDGTVAVFSRKGGVGKTTISAYLGATLAVERGGRIIALDGDAEAGSLGWLLAPRAPSTLAALSSADPIPTDYASIRRYTVSTRDGLDVIVGDPAEMGPISTTGLEAVADQLSRHYDVSIFDTGAGVTRATGRVLVNSARVLLLVMGPSVDSVRAAERTLAWIDERPGEAADPDVKVIAVINGIPETAKKSHVDKIESHFSDRCDAVVRIPWDQYLAAGSTSVSLDRLGKPTRQAFLELAATTVGTLARPARRPAAAGARRAS